MVPTGDTSAVAQLLLDIYTGKEKVHRDLSHDRELDGKSDPNSVAERFVGSYETTLPRVHDDKYASSEDFWTVGNAARWMLLFSRVLGLDKPSEGVSLKTEDVRLLEEMKIGEKLQGKGVDGENVWKMLMGSDMLEGEAELKE